MLDTVFMRVLDMTRTGSLVILAVLVARLLLKKAPKVFSYGLWAVVLFRLLCPVSLEAPVSVIPDIRPVSESYTLAEVPVSPLGAGTAALQAVGDAVNGGLGIQQIPTTMPDGNGGVAYVQSLWWEVWVLVGQYIWLAGLVCMGIHAVISYARLKKQLLTASPLGENIYMADGIASAFVLGLLRPRIYLPSALEKKEQSYILLHEQHHIRRLDHFFKALGFLALCVHWFNPLVWLAFVLAGKDMEMSCDEAVIRKLGEGVRGDYAASLLSLATGRRILVGMPLAFGEGDPKSRIRNLANWKKPTAWILVISLVLCLAVALVLLTNPMASRSVAMDGKNVADLEPEKIVSQILRIHRLEDLSEVRISPENFEIQLTGDFDWYESPAVSFFFYKDKACYGAQLRIFPEENRFYVTQQEQIPAPDREYLFLYYLQALQYLPKEQIGSISSHADSYIVTMMEDGTPADFDTSVTYTSRGVGEIDGWFIHLRVLPMYSAPDGGYTGKGEKEIHLFFGGNGKEVDAQLYPGTTYVSYQCIYMNPLSSYAAIGGDSGYVYRIHEDCFESVHRTYGAQNLIDVPRWQWQPFPYTREQWESLFFPEGLWYFDIFAYYDEILYQPLTAGKFLLRVDGDLWLVELHADKRAGVYLWSVYSLVPQSVMGAAQWEFAPEQSFGLPAFRFSFDMPCTQITASCVTSLLWDYDSPNGESGSLVTLDSGDSLYWIPTDKNGDPVTQASIRFTVQTGEAACYSGTLYITLTEEKESPLPRYTYTATLVGTGLHLEPSAEGGVITLVSD